MFGNVQFQEFSGERIVSPFKLHAACYFLFDAYENFF